MAESLSPSGTPRRSALNPLRCTGTPLPPNLLLAAKLIVLALLLNGNVAALPEPFLGMWPIFERLPRPDLVRLAVQAVFLTAAAGLLLNRCVRACALAAGVVFLLVPLMSRGDYTNGKFFCGAVLALIGLYHDRRSVWLLRAQLVVMYLGSGLNKLLEPDWLNGRYFEHWLVHMRRSDLYIAAAAALPPLALSTALGWVTIAVELSLAAMLVWPRCTRTAIWLALLFHTGSVVLADSTFGVFYYALAAAFLVLVPWPAPGGVLVRHRADAPLWSMIRSVSARLDADRLIRWRADPAARPATLTIASRTYRRLGAIVVCALVHPATYFAAMIAATSVDGWKRRLLLVTALAAAFPLTSRLLDRLAERPHALAPSPGRPPP